ncbi:hypothetical protein GCM10008957_52370 [Deinococcus ruber]|uniref:Uncharacterized protein n=1 Tax=Deinococcus ruber TaxID=1848197 RepID=A0A918FGE0_9DEIO|nr:hypothetical protein GCM10008957_52370 [Deinococcus ruber]
MNDFYLADVRVALLNDVEFKGDQCSGFQISVSEATGGQWYPEARLATLVTQVPIVFEPCGQGLLSLNLTGRKGKGAFPRIRFSQNSHIKKELDTSDQAINVQIPLENSPLTVTLINPYGKTLEDRNLYVSDLSWRQKR